MKIMRICLLILFSLLFYHTSLYSFIYEVYVLRKWLPEKMDYHHIIGLSDFHDRSIPASVSQRAQLLKQLGCCNAQQVKVIVEDLSSRNHNGDFGCECFFLRSNTGLLSGMSQECQQRGIDVENVEYRYCRVIALAPILHSMINSSNILPFTQHITVNHMIKEIDKAIHAVQSYHHPNLALRSHIARTIETVKKELVDCKMQHCAAQFVGDYVLNIVDRTQRLAFLKKILIMDSCLLDIKLFHAVLSSQHKKTVMVLAGGTHIKKMGELLKQAGYHTVHHTRANIAQEHDLKKCRVGLDIINGSFCLKPYPVSIDVIDQFLK